MTEKERPPESLINRLRFSDPVYVTRPSMPPFGEFVDLLRGIWESRRLTNEGPLHRELEERLAARLDVPHVGLCCNGTSALLVALKLLGIDGGEVITTPLTFPSTVHALSWLGIRPVFCDIDEETLTLDPARIGERVGSETRAILPVHLFGRRCDCEGIGKVAAEHGLPVIYDAAHAVGARFNGRSIVAEGDASVLSFHATKPFTTLEGGAVAVHSEEHYRRVGLLRNAGILDEEHVAAIGINAKMNEMQAAFGLLHLRLLEGEIAGRRSLAELYRRRLGEIPGIEVVAEKPGVERSYSHMPVLVDTGAFGLSRDELSLALRRFNVHARKYFTPLCSRYPHYASLPSADPAGLTVAERIARRILCLPLYGSLEREAVERICEIIAALQERGF